MLTRRGLLFGTIAAALLIGGVVPAQSGTVILRVNSTECTGTTCQFTFTVPDATLTRYINAYRAVQGQVKVDPGCVDNPGATPPVVCQMRDRTAPEVVRGWAKGILQGTMNNVISHERAGASKSASDAINDVNVPDPN